MFGQLPFECATPGSVFEKVGMDYAGPFRLSMFSCKPTIVLCIFVSLTVKAIHLELVSDLTVDIDTFVPIIHTFIAWCGHPLLIWSDHGTNFVGASHELKELAELLENHNRFHRIIAAHALGLHLNLCTLAQARPHSCSACH